MRILKKIKRAIYESEELLHALKNGIVLDVKNKPSKNMDLIQTDKKIYFPFKKSKENYSRQLFEVAFEISFNDELKRFSDEQKMVIYPELIKSGNEMMQFFHDFMHNDQRVVKFANTALKEQLENTDIKDLMFDDLPLFYDSFYISIEKNFEIEEDKIYVDGIMVTNFKDSLKICAPVLEYHNEYKDKYGDVTALNFYTVSIIKGDNIESSIKEAINKCFQTNEDGFNMLKESSFLDDIDKKKDQLNNNDSMIMNYISKMAINTIFFHNAAKSKKNSLFTVESKDERLKDSFPLHKTNKAVKKFSKKISDANYYYILKNSSQQNISIEESQKRGPIKKQFYVSGHYRKQPIGKRDQEERQNKIIWIQSYIKGTGFTKSPDKIKIDVI